MARRIEKFAQLEGQIWAFLDYDGSLRIEHRYDGTGKQWSYVDALELSPEGVKELVSLLVRDAQLRIGADDAGHSEACDAISRHEKYKAMAYDFCPYCGERLHS